MLIWKEAIMIGRDYAGIDTLTERARMTQKSLIEGEKISSCAYLFSPPGP